MPIIEYHVRSDDETPQPEEHPSPTCMILRLTLLAAGALAAVTLGDHHAQLVAAIFVFLGLVGIIISGKMMTRR